MSSQSSDGISSGEHCPLPGPRVSTGKSGLALDSCLGFSCWLDICFKKMVFSHYCALCWMWSIVTHLCPLSMRQDGGYRKMWDSWVGRNQVVLLWPILASVVLRNKSSLCEQSVFWLTLVYKWQLQNIFASFPTIWDLFTLGCRECAMCLWRVVSGA